MQRLNLTPNYSHHTTNRSGRATLFFVFPLMRMPDAFTAETTAGHPLYAAIEHYNEDNEKEQLRLGRCIFSGSRSDREGQKVVSFEFEAAELSVTVSQLDQLRTKPIELVLIDIDAGTSGSTEIQPVNFEEGDDNE